MDRKEEGRQGQSAGPVAAVSPTGADDGAPRMALYVSLVGLVVVGLGLIAGGRMDRSSPARLLALVSVCVALLAVVVAMGSLLLRHAMAPAVGSGTDVVASDRRTSKRRYAPVAAGLLVLVAFLVAGAAAVTLLVGDRPGPQPSISAQLVGIGAQASLTVHAEFTGVAAGQILHTEIIGVDATETRTVLARAVANAGRDGTVSTTLEASQLGEYRSVVVTAEAGTDRCTATLVPGWTADPANLSCTVRK